MLPIDRETTKGVVYLIALILTAGICGAFPSEDTNQAPFRLVVGVAAIAFVPGCVAVRALGWFGGSKLPLERLPLWFGVGYCILTMTCALSVLCRLSLSGALAFLAAFTMIAAFVGVERRATGASGNPEASRAADLGIVLPLAIGVVLVGGWFLEPPIMGEETVELITIRKIAQNPTMSLDGLLAEPGAVPTYVITPYYFFVALVAKVSGLSIFAAYLKLRAVYTGLALLSLGALSSRLVRAGGGRLAEAVMIGASLLVFVDPSPWSWPASLFPLVRRGGFCAGVLAPIFMLSLLAYVMPREAASRSKYEWLMPGLLMVSILTTHAMEILYAGFFGLAIVLAAKLQPPLGIDWSRVRGFVASALVGAIAFKLVHAELVTHVQAFEAPARAHIAAVLRAELREGMLSVRGIGEAGKYLISTSGAILPHALLGFVLTPALILARPFAGTVLWAGIAAPLAIYSSSKLFALLQFATSSEIIFIFGYIAFLGTMALLISVSVVVGTLADAAPRLFPSRGPMSRVLLLALAAFPVGYLVAICVRAVLAAALAHPLWVLWTTLAGGVAALTWRARGRFADSPGALAAFPVLVVAALVGGLGFGLRGLGQIHGPRDMLPQAVVRALAAPSVLDWPHYYPVLQATANPPIDLPAHIVGDLEHLLPPLTTVIADPKHSYSLPVVLNQHIVNPGHRISTSLAYFERYTREENGVRVHPIFNSDDTLSSLDIRFLLEYRVEYVLVNPPHRTVVGRKLAGIPGVFDRVYSREGFELYQVRHDGLRTRS